MNKPDARSMNLAELQVLTASLGEPAYRSGQVFGWLHERGAESFNEMTNIPASLRQKLAERTGLYNLIILDKIQSAKDGAVKYMFGLKSGAAIESVLMGYGYGDTLCVSSQAGCRMGCRFCASSACDFDGSLTAGEMAAQVYTVQKDTGRRVSNVVVMGIGEPFDNYDNVIRFLRLLNDPKGLRIGWRAMTVSTCGLADGILKFAEEGFQVNLAVSLHAPNDGIRKQLMPVANRYDINTLLAAIKAYTDKTNRRVTYEYALIAGVNDSPECAKELGARLQGTLCHVNLITLNGVSERDYPPSGTATGEQFRQILKKHGIETTIRRSRGADIDAACGQLRLKHKKQTN